MAHKITILAFFHSLIFCFISQLDAEVTIRLVAADKKGKTLVSDVVYFRKSPDGGLVATQWLSKVSCNGELIFEIKDPKEVKMKLQDADAMIRESDSEDLDDLDLEEESDEPEKAKKSSAEASKNIRPVDMVDPMYKGQNYYSLSVGPGKSRYSEASISVKGQAYLEPGKIKIKSSGTVNIPCYPVTMMVVRAGTTKTIKFYPEIRWKSNDLLADCLFDHSPDMPLGDNPNPSKYIQGYQRELLRKGAKRFFRKLTLYLPANDKTPYWFNGYAFNVNKNGVQIVDPANSALQVQKDNPFTLHLHQKSYNNYSSIALIKDSRPDIRVKGPFFKDRNNETFDDICIVPPKKKNLDLSLKAKGVKGNIGLPVLDLSGKDLFKHATAIIITPSTGRFNETIARLVALPPSSHAKSGELSIHVAQASMEGESEIPNKFSAILKSWTQINPSIKASHNLTFSKKGATEAGKAIWRANLKGVSPGVYGLIPNIDPPTSKMVPVVVSSPSTKGSLSIINKNSRSDYMRGSQIKAIIVMRSLENISNQKVALDLIHESGENLSLGKFTLQKSSKHVNSTPISVDTNTLRLGWYTLVAKAQNHTPHPLRFKIYSSQPKTTFTLFNWHDSFSGPIQHNGKYLPNAVFSPRLLNSLSNDQMKKAIAQNVLPRAFQMFCKHDPLYPPFERTLTYDTFEADAASAMRAGITYSPGYGLGMTGQEAEWNPPHTLPYSLDRIRRNCSLIAQRHRDFGSYNGLQFNWYHNIKQHYEGDSPPTDGHGPEQTKLFWKETGKIWDLTGDTGGLKHKELKKMDPKNPKFSSRHAQNMRDSFVSAGKYKAGVFGRAYRFWTDRVRTMKPGAGDATLTAQTHLGSRQSRQDLSAPGLFPGQPAYVSYIATGWFTRTLYYPPAYYEQLPVAGVASYTDYGYAPFQPLFAIDYYACGQGDKPIWSGVMGPNNRSVGMRLSLLMMGRGADGIDLNKLDGDSYDIVAQLASKYGPAFRTRPVNSDIAILGSFRQNVSDKPAFNVWMGYLGGELYNMYKYCFYARRPAAFLLDEEIVLEKLLKHKLVFLIDQRVPLPKKSMDALRQYVKKGGVILKNKSTASFYPGITYELKKLKENDPRLTKWDSSKYKDTKDGFFVASLKSYEQIAPSLNALFKKHLPAPAISSERYEVQVATLGGKKSKFFFATNERRRYPELVHPSWNHFWGSIIAIKSEINFDKPYVLYDLLEGSKMTKLSKRKNGRYVMPIDFSRSAGRAYAALEQPIDKVRAQSILETEGGLVPVKAELLLKDGSVLNDPMPFSISISDTKNIAKEIYYRAMGPGITEYVTIPKGENSATWNIILKDQVSGKTATLKVSRKGSKIQPVQATPVLVTRLGDVQEFLKKNRKVYWPGGTPKQARTDSKLSITLGEMKKPESEKRFLILIDKTQLGMNPGNNHPTLKEAQKLLTALKKSGRNTRLEIVDPLDIPELYNRWYPNQRDKQYIADAKAGKKILQVPPREVSYNTNYAAPNNGHSEIGPRHKIYSEVILLGNIDQNRFLKDLHAKEGWAMSQNAPARGSALIQVVFDAFVPRWNALSIQAHGTKGLQQGVSAILKILNKESKLPAPVLAQGKLKSVTSGDKEAQYDYINESFGAIVNVGHEFSDGRLFLATGIQGKNYFITDSNGKVQKSWKAKYAITFSKQNKIAWIHPLWGVPGFVNKIICATPDMKFNWMMDLHRYRNTPARPRLLALNHSNDIVTGGPGYIKRISPDGKVKWMIDDISYIQDPTSFMGSRDLVVKSQSPDGKLILASAFGGEYYLGRYLTDFINTSVMIIEAETGKVLKSLNDRLVFHSACTFVNGGIFFSDMTKKKTKLVLTDYKGNITWESSNKTGAVWGWVDKSKKWLVYRTADKFLHLNKGVSKGQKIFTIDLKTNKEIPVPLSADIHWVDAHDQDNIFIVSTVDGWLRAFKPDSQLVWERRFNNPISLSSSKNGKVLYGETTIGKLLWIDPKSGRTIKSKDYMEYNSVDDHKRFIAEYKRSPAGAPIYMNLPQANERLFNLKNNEISWSPDLSISNLKNQTLSVGKKVSLNAKQKSGKTHIINFFVEAPKDTKLSHLLTIVKEQGGKEIYRAPLGLSQIWSERNVAWKASSNKNVVISIQNIANPKTKGCPVKIRDLEVRTLNISGPNLLYQKPLTVGADMTSMTEDDDIELEGIDVQPPDYEYHIPNDVDGAAKSKGAPPFKVVCKRESPFDGNVIAHKKSSWKGKPVMGGSTHATLTITFKNSVKISALTVFEDTTSLKHFTDTYGVFGKGTDNKWFQIGSVNNNKNPFNLFTFAKRDVTDIMYLWLKSGDGHARIAEMEAFGPKDMLIP